jgi:hypothetical protein
MLTGKIYPLSKVTCSVGSPATRMMIMIMTTMICMTSSRHIFRSTSLNRCSGPDFVAFATVGLAMYILVAIMEVS